MNFSCFFLRFFGSCKNTICWTRIQVPLYLIDLMDLSDNSVTCLACVQVRDVVKCIDGPHSGRQGEIKHLFRYLPPSSFYSFDYISMQWISRKCLLNVDNDN
jgi:hypothetical protein